MHRIHSSRVDVVGLALLALGLALAIAPPPRSIATIPSTSD